MRASLADPPAELPSTMNSSHSRGSFEEQSTSLPGSPAPSSALLRRVRSRAWRAARRARCACIDLATIWLPSLGFSSEASQPETSRSSRLDERTDPVNTFPLHLTLELGLGESHRDDRGQSLADVLAWWFLVAPTKKLRFRA